ncbi:MAG TPA: class I SAM-dependent methyltransferase [Edaphobacter sp.]|uniref:class I SAM-dependent methyltransferase n=1 Tax=Edaphobacter sp. TaxID=1934404 RepID=UPI002BD5183A|nr:class I SAM-dependent methyltransferase [Edaphobacter sp.]HUZ97123.1 class I SAM-dependent methyltransferase [Edaphobacter sp.]
MSKKPIPIRPRDLLKATSTPVHPFDQIHGVETSGLVPAANLITGHPNDEHVTAYYGVAPSILRTLIDLWRETPPPEPIHNYTFIDIGAGKGRAMLVASELPFHQIIGIELNPAMATIASQNIDRWHQSHAADSTAPRLAPIQLQEQDALSFDFPSTPTLVFLFHPFEAPVLKQLLRRIETQFAKRPGTLDILYVNAECRTVLDKHPAFIRLFNGPVAMSPEDHTADLAAIAQQEEYGSTGDEECAIYRYTGRAVAP